MNRLKGLLKVKSYMRSILDEKSHLYIDLALY
jgi:hypothetical protein